MGPRGVPWPSRGVPWPLYEEYAAEPAIMIYSQSTSCLYRQLRHTKSAEYWNDKVEANQSDPHKLWQLVDDLLGRGRTPAN